MATSLVRIQNRRKTAAAWTAANEVLLQGEFGVETDTSKYKVGDGSTTWTLLKYAGVDDASVAAIVGNSGATRTALDARYASLASPAFTGTPTINGAAISTGGGGGGGTALPANTRTALTKFYGLAADRNTKPVWVVACGDSWTQGSVASSETNAWIARLQGYLNRQWPLDNGTQPTALAWLGNYGTATNGLRTVNNGHGGSTSAGYLPSNEITQIGALQPAMVIHAPGLNDQAQGVPAATFKANVQAAIRALKAAITTPHVHLLVLNPALGRAGNPVLWSDYGAALTQLAAEDPTNVVFVDLAAVFAQVGFTQANWADPLALSDGAHMVDRGHAFYADVLWDAIRPITTVGAALPATPTILNTTAPTITGTAQTGQALTVSTGSWSVAPDSYTYQWTRDGAAITAANTNTYNLVTADEGHQIRAVVTAVKGGYANGAGATVQVVPTGAPSTTLTNSVLPAITGTATLGNVLTVSNGTWSQTPDSYTYQWKRAGANIAGATASTYTVVSGDVGQAITATVTAVKAGYTSGSATSNPVTPAAGGTPTQASENFAGTDGAAWPTQWGSTAGDGTATIQSNAGVMTVSSTGATYKMMQLTGMTPSTDQSLYVEYTTPASGALFFGLNTPTFSYTVPGTGYWIKALVGGNVEIYRNNSWQSQVYFQMAASTAYKVRVERSGSVFRWRMWLANATEPGTWTGTFTDATPLGSGTVWLETLATGGAITATFDNLVVT